MPAAALGGGASPCASGGGEKEEVGAAGPSLVHLVAVKEFNFAAARRTPPLGILRLFRQEVETLEALSHPKVAGLVAAVLSPRPMLLLELLGVGSLFDVMHGHGANAAVVAAAAAMSSIMMDLENSYMFS